MIQQSINKIALTLYWAKAAVIAILVGLLVGCPIQSTQQLNYDETKNSNYYLSQANATSGSDKINWQLLAVRSLIAENHLAQANQYLLQIPSELNKVQQKEFLLLQGELAVKRTQSFNINLINLNELDDQQKIRYYHIKIAVDGNNQDINAQVRDYIELEKYGTEKQRHQAINSTWQYLVSLEQSAINSVLVYANEPTLQGWIDLIYTHHNNNGIYIIDKADSAEIVSQKEEAQYNLLKRAVEEWSIQYAEHPAAIYLPRAIYGEKYLLPEDSNSRKVALFLPLSGSSKVFGDAIQLGYFDANRYYPNEPQQNITIFDTNSAPLSDLLAQAEKQHVDLIVGPLLKDTIKAMQQINTTIPVLALNKLEYNENANTQEKICYFGLAPEDEAMDAAQHIYSQKKRIPLLIVPQNELGKRVEESFLQQWKNYDDAGEIYVQYFESAAALSKKMNSGYGIELEGELLNNYITQPDIITNDNDTSINAFLTLFSGNDQQNQQAPETALDNDIDKADEEEADDEIVFDAIYIYATHDELSLIKSMLEMKSNKTVQDDEGNEIIVKKNIPAIFTSSRSHIANVTQDFRYDMDRVQFSEIPLIASKNAAIETLPSYISNDYSLVRLYAMGVDAWRLANRFNDLHAYQMDIFDGMTGKLSVGQQCEIMRELPWKQYRKGQEIILR